MKVIIVPLFILSNSLVANDLTVTAEVNWITETVNGGLTSLALGLLCLATLAIVIERFLRLHLKFFASQDLRNELNYLWTEKKHREFKEKCAEHPCTLTKVASYCHTHAHNSLDLLYSGAADIVHRDIRKQLNANTPLAVAAALAPLLGLLGTMIGMIESFKLVELYGDEGGASMLAGSISKALITTAVGLIVAIGAMVCFHFFKYKTSRIAEELEYEVEQMLNHWFLKKRSVELSKSLTATKEKPKSKLRKAVS